MYDIYVGREYADYFPFNRDAVVVDVGAHYGYFSLFALQNLSPNSRIVSIEPSSDNLKIFKENIKKVNDTHIILIEKALYSKSDLNLDFNTSMEGYNHHISHSIGNKVRTISIEDIMKSNNISKIDFLKMDCEGSEYEIILDSPGEVFETIETISMEYHDRKIDGYSPLDIVEKLKILGYSVRKFEASRDLSYQNLNFGKIIASRH